MQKYIVFFESNKIINSNNQLIIASKYYEHININDEIYWAEIKNNNHILSEYGYCYNCAYMTWDINQPIRKYCAPLIYQHFFVKEKTKNKNNIFLTIQLIKKFNDPKWIFNFEYHQVNQSVLKIVNILH